MIWIAHDNVVENVDSEELASPDEVTGDFDVRFGRRRFPARMIVTNDDGCRTGHDCQPEDFPGMTENRIHGPNGHQIVTFNTPTCVEDENYQIFTLAIEVRMTGDMCFPISGCLIGCFALLHGVGCGTFSK